MSEDLQKNSFDMNLYLKLTSKGNLVDRSSQPNLNLLETLVFNHVSSIHYQNYTLFNRKEIADMSPGALLKRLLVERKGGMCYDTSELMFHVLNEFKFDVKRVNVVVIDSELRNHDEPRKFLETLPSDHNVLVVKIQGRMYLVDVGFGYNSMRAPVHFSFDSTEEKEVILGEKYQLFCAEDYYQMNFWLKNQWTPFFAFARPLNYIDQQQSMALYRNLVTRPERAVIRDSVIYVGVIFEKGRFGFSCDYDSEKGATNFNLLTVIDGIANTKKMDVQGFIDAIHEHLDLSMRYTVDSNNVIRFIR